MEEWKRTNVKSQERNEAIKPHCTTVHPSFSLRLDILEEIWIYLNPPVLEQQSIER